VIEIEEPERRLNITYMT